jgi:hypothetical protein
VGPRGRAMEWGVRLRGFRQLIATEAAGEGLGSREGDKSQF